MAMSDTDPIVGEGHPATEYAVGELVWIKKYGCIYQAEVVKVGKTRLTVNFKPKTAPARDFTFSGHDVLWYVRKATDRLT